ncbi:hypothetical protein INR49_015144, partial [Caranx melampygus]
GSTDGDDAQQHRGEQRQQRRRRGPELASAPPRAGEQQHPWGFLVDGEPLAGTQHSVFLQDKLQGGPAGCSFLQLPLFCQAEFDVHAGRFFCLIWKMWRRANEMLSQT